MKKYMTNYAALLSVAVLAGSLLMASPQAHANVCAEGTGLPPFLSSGADPNLLLVIDNSGSMLDTAYVENVDECVDNAYDSTKTYAGLFDPTKGYRWTEGVAPWVSGTTYNNGDYVYTEGIFYQASGATGNPSVGAEIAFDSSVTWAKIYEIDTWVHGTAYVAGDFVEFEGQLYKAINSGISSDPVLTDDISIEDANGTAVIWEKVDSTWVSGGVYATGDIVSDKAMLFANKSGANTKRPSEDIAESQWQRLNAGYFEETTLAAAGAALAAAAGDSYTHPELYVKIVSVLVDAVLTPSTVSYFAATGNLLNWASASKFDIQKKILTGGKYDAYQQHLVSQSRGCSDHSFYKEVPVTDSGGVSRVLTLGTKGPSDDEWIDSTDSTTRISVLGVSTGFADSARAASCEAAVEAVLSGSLGDIHQDVTDCLDYGGTNNIMAESNSAYNHSLWSCWKIRTSPYTLPSQLGQMTEVEQSCEHIYDLDMPPATITPDFSGYACYGIYNGNADPANADPLPDPLRPGYVGRCWEPSSIPADCATVACPAGTPYDTGNPRCFTDDLMYECSGNFNVQQDSCNKPWVLQLVDAVPASGLCTPAAIAAATPAQWTDDNNPNAKNECLQQAMWDYCQGITVPEVIDPSDQIFDTNVSWGLPGALVDSGIVSLLGTDRPLLVMQGYIKQTTTPEGVLHEVADELRIGAMAFNHNGANTECSSPAAIAGAGDTIVQYCPDGNKDGARVIAPILAGNAAFDHDSNAATPDVPYIDFLSAAINDIRANAWTPLAEAIYNALGYYGQRTDRRLDALINGDDFYTESEDATWTDPVQYWCQQNHILVITEGASTTDLHPKVIELVDTTMPALTPPLVDSAAVETECFDVIPGDLLFGSTYFDDVVYFGAKAPAAELYATPQITNDDGDAFDKQNVLTHIVTTGVLRDNGDATDECNPKTIMQSAADNAETNLLSGENPAQLEDNLRATLSDILSRVSAGSAASVISSSRSGSGAVYQAIFWPQQVDSNDNEVTWVGDVHGLFLDSAGALWEDTVADRVLDTAVDNRVRFYFDNFVSPARTRVCYANLIYPEDLNANDALDMGEDLNNNGVLDIGCSAAAVELDTVNYLWAVAAPNADGWLSDITLDTAMQRSGANFISDTRARYIFTWNDINNDGIVDAGEQVDFTYNDLMALPAVSGSRGPLLNDFDVADTFEFERVVSWVRGAEQPAEDSNGNGVLDAGEDLNGNGVLDPAMRSRLFENKSWLLGDVIHSTPTLVGRPMESYHFVYQDPSYSYFAKKYAKRRNVVYFGANDGMLHAINAGFFIEDESKFCLSGQLPCDAAAEAGQPALGAELWAYIPYNLQPHLKCLTDPNYDHKYYVDQRPRIFDVQIFEDDCDYSGLVTDCSAAVHPGGWGTILVGGMRFGGSPVEAATLNGDATDLRKFISSTFILDVTDPEEPPVLLGEMTMTTDNTLTDLGYSISSPSLVIMRDSDGSTEWYLALGNGPTNLKGENTEQGKVAIMPLENLAGESTFVPPAEGPSRLTFVNTATKKPFRIPDAEPADPVGEGRFLIPAAASGDTESFVSDIVSVDYDVNSQGTVGIGAPYKSDAIYFGTIDGAGFADCAGKKCWDGGGRMFRLVTRVAAFDPAKNDLNANGLWDSGENFTQEVSKPWEWSLSTMLDAQGPVSSGPGIGWDGFNFWIYFGTGRFFDTDDKTDAQTQRFFGVREPVNCTNNELSWAEINWWAGAAVPPNPALSATNRGLMKVDDILVVEGTGNLHCEDGTTNCRHDHLGNTITTFDNLRTYIVGETCPQGNATIGLDGWYRELADLRERNLGQSTLLGGLITFSTYKPYADVCQAEGESFLYGVHYQTGTSWTKNLFGLDASGHVLNRISLGKGLALTPSLHVGSGDADATAFVQTSTGEIIEISQEELPLGNFKSGRSSWRQE